MKRILYTKYNSLRRTELQIKTSIVMEDDEKYVTKTAMNEAAENAVFNMKRNYELLSKIYKEIKVVPYTEINQGLRFEFKKGKKLFDKYDLVHDDADTILKNIKKTFDIVLGVDEAYIEEFEMTDKFKAFFPNCIPQNEKAFKVANIDSIFSNFIECDGEIWCLDYEWVLDFDVPINFIVYRCLHYFYEENKAALINKISFEELYYRLGLPKNNLSLYQEMEKCFQIYVHGEDSKYMYVNKYLKTNTRIEDLKKVIISEEQRIQNLNVKITALYNQIEHINSERKHREQHIKNLEHLAEVQRGQIDKINRLKRNPFYIFVMIFKKVYYKVMFRFGSKRWKEEHRLGKYKYKYRDLMVREDDYETWAMLKEEKEKYNEKFAYNPKISVVVPVYNVKDEHLTACIDSVINQVYNNWELCLADDNSTWENVRTTLERYKDNPKIKIVYREENGHISKATNSAIEIADGEFIAFMDCDDTISPNALYEVVKKLNENNNLDFIYSDEDKIDEDGQNRHMPHFKPDWSPDTFMSFMYTSHLGVYRKSLVDEIGGLRPGFEGAQDYDLTLRFTEKTDRIAHIPKVLYHWRETEKSTAGSVGTKPYILDATIKAKEEALKRRGIDAKLELVAELNQFRIKYEIKDNPLVSIIIPSKDNYEILKRCLQSLDKITGYKNYEIILVDNGSNDENKKLYTELSEQYRAKYIYEKMDFNFSRMCNIGAKNANGGYLLFLNDDTEIIETEWLERMLGQAEQKHTGAVGAKLYYPDRVNIQHIGVIKPKVGPAHAFGGCDDSKVYYFGRNRMDYNYVAVTAACLLVATYKFQEIEGFNEELAVAYNDVDLCFKLVEHGYYNVVRNDAVLIHHESVSRGYDFEDYDKIQRLMSEQKRLYKMHPTLAIDPFYNINLSQIGVDFSLNIEDKKEEYNSFTEGNIENKSKKEAVWSLDLVRIVQSVYVYGWAYLKDYKKNNDLDTKIILYNDKHSYIISTDKIYRPDVAESHRADKDIEFTGFRGEVLRENLERGIYKIDIVCKRRRIVTEKEIEI